MEARPKGGCENGKLHKIGELARLANVSRRTIDYYTQLGLLNPQRSASGYRYYTEEDTVRLKLVELYKQEHLTLEEIRERLQFESQTTNDTQQATEKVQEIQALMCKLEEHLLELKPFLATLDEKQWKALTQSAARKGTTLFNLLAILFQVNPFV
ncbi:DNA-binding transcriptional MerR regulator [Tumebacillus sp. BK434]|uniref:MerR family transcriptional regulator n=1 Tax=Tumebacillus sp. BK434 TaxID=2512169 RepID=UPI001043E945|nr:MerR family transcriptional regulator [Tumebacillus sp. BK434]TCP58144.1 DNA-binding transcriptional MerR regulator [Tumebacillus sp. BK434]